MIDRTCEQCGKVFQIPVLEHLGSKQAILGFDPASKQGDFSASIEAEQQKDGTVVIKSVKGKPPR